MKEHFSVFPKQLSAYQPQYTISAVGLEVLMQASERWCVVLFRSLGKPGTNGPKRETGRSSTCCPCGTPLFVLAYLCIHANVMGVCWFECGLYLSIPGSYLGKGDKCKDSK